MHRWAAWLKKNRICRNNWGRSEVIDVTDEDIAWADRQEEAQSCQSLCLNFNFQKTSRMGGRGEFLS